MRSAAEAIPGHRVIISAKYTEKALRGATAIVKPNEIGAYDDMYVCVELDEPWASRWGTRVIFVRPVSLRPAPEYAALAKELIDTREAKDNLTRESEAMSRRLEIERAAKREAQKLVEDQRNTITRYQTELDKVQAEQEKLLNELFAANQRLAGQPLAQWERDLLGLPVPATFKYPVRSTTTLGLYYEITVMDNQVIDCTCPGFHFHGHCKHADHFIIPADAWADALRYQQNKADVKAQDVLRQVAELVRQYQ